MDKEKLEVQKAHAEKSFFPVSMCGSLPSTMAWTAPGKLTISPRFVMLS